MKKTVKQHDKYEPGTVILELSEAEYEALRGFVAAVTRYNYADKLNGTPVEWFTDDDVYPILEWEDEVF